MLLTTTLSLQYILFTVLGGLGIFLFGIHIMGEGLKGLAGSKLKIIIEKTTNTPFKGIITGVLVTALVQSSSGVTAIVIGLISAGLMTLPQAIAVIMGANIGTTVTAILIGFNIGAYALPIIALGALICFFIKNKRIYLIGTTILGFGMLFYGLELMGGTLKIVAKEPFFANLMTSLSKYPALGVFTGAIVTAIIQSSSAAIGILQQIYTNGDITLFAAIPILLGSNIGTTITAILSSLGATRNAKRAALGHLLFNVIGTILFLAVLGPFTKLMASAQTNLTFLQASPAGTIALAHVIFNVTTTVFLYFFIHLLVKIVIKLIPYSAVEEQQRAIDKLEPSLIKKAPVLALESAHSVIIDMGEIVERMFMMAKKYINEYDSRIPEEAQIYEDTVDNYDNKIHDYLAKLTTTSFGIKEMKLHAIFFDTISDLERIGDHSMNLIEFMTARYTANIQFHPESLEMVNHLLDLLTMMIKDAQYAFKHNDKSAARRVRAMEPQIDELEKKYRRHESQLISTGIITHQDIHFVDILSNLERIGDHANNISDNILFESIHDSKDFKKSNPV